MTFKAKHAHNALAGLALSMCLPVMAQEAGSGFSYGLDTELRYDDNIYRAETREKGSFILEASPFVTATWMNQGNSYQVGYRLNYAEYFSSGRDSYDDHEFTLDVNHRFTGRQAINAGITHRLLTEQLGTGFSQFAEDIARGPDDYQTTQYQLTYMLGAPTARTRIDLNASRDVLDFDSSFVGNTRDYKADQFGAVLRYRIGARTDLLAEYRNLRVRYDNRPLDETGAPINLDSDEDFFLAGVAWELTARTRGEVRIGRSERDYKDGRFSESGAHWEAELEWRPRSYSSFVLTTARESLETYGTGRFINTKRHDLSWNHAWRGRLSSRIQLGLIEDDYEDSTRKDDQFYWGASLFYEPVNWMELSGGISYWENDSNFNTLSYDRNLYYIRANIEF